ncbi:MAG TPA: pitrilysin family protein [Candidatus Polarisedimenticolaceae bacterium]|nr:pitrilysin family protein [Candidatus Polarisedimenticolaceae bacterium]
MKPWTLLLLGGLALGSAAAAEQPMTRFFPYPTHVTTLDNGLKLIVVPMRSGELVAYWSIVRTGSRDEYEPGRSGFAHFFEHMMFRGTKTYPASVYNEWTTRMGANANAFTSTDLTAYHLGIAAGDLETVMKLESDRFQHLDYPEQAFRTEAGAVYGEYRKNRTSPFFTAYEALQRTAFQAHTYGHTTIGYEQDIAHMPELYDYSKAFFSRYYRPENVVLLIVGAVEPEPTLALVRQYYGGWQRGYVTPQIPVEPEQTAERHVEVSYDGRTLPIVWIAYKARRFDPADTGYVALGLLGELAFGETSPIYKKLVLDEQVVETLSASQDLHRDPGLFEVIARVKEPAKLDYVRQEIDRVIAGFREQPPAAERLADLKSRVKYGFLMGLDTPDNVADALARPISITGGLEGLEQWYTTIETITPEQVRAAAREQLVPQRRTVAVLQGRP